MEPLISPLFLLPGIAMISLVAGAILWWQHGKPNLWPFIWWGVLAWAISIACNMPVTPSSGCTWVC
jgi:hypothetical protein